MKFHGKIKAYRIAHPWKYRGIRLSIFGLLKLIGVGWLIPWIIWPPFAYKIGLFTYNVGHMSPSDILMGLEHFGWKKAALLGTAACTGLMGWWHLDIILEKVSAILFKPEPVSVKWVNPENAPGKWLKVITEQKKLSFFENLSKSFLKFKIIIDDIFIDKQTKLLIDRQIRYLEDLGGSVEFRTKAYVSALGDLHIYQLAVLENNYSPRSISAFKAAKILVDNCNKELAEVCKEYSQASDALFSNRNIFYILNTPRIGKTIATENFPNVEINFTNRELLAVREFELVIEKRIKIRHAKELFEARKQGLSKFAIAELKLTHIEEIALVYNQVEKIQGIHSELEKAELNHPARTKLAEERIAKIKVIDEIWLKNISPDKWINLEKEINAQIEKYNFELELIQNYEVACDVRLIAEDKQFVICMEKARDNCASDEEILWKTKEYMIEREKKADLNEADVAKKLAALNAKHGTREEIISKVKGKFIAEEHAREMDSIKNMVDLQIDRKKSLFIHYYGLPDENFAAEFGKREAVNNELKELFKKGNFNLRDHNLPRPIKRKWWFLF